MTVCHEIKTRLGELLDGVLDADARQAVARHLDQCADCRAEYDSLRSMTSILARPPAGAVSPGLWEAIEERLHHDRDDSRKRPERVLRRAPLYRLVRRSLAAAAVVVLGVGLGWVVWSAPWAAPAEAAQIDFRPLLEQADGDIEAGIKALLRAYGGEKITRAEASKRMKVRVHPPEEVPGELRLKSMHLLKMGRHHKSLAFHFQGPGGQLLLLQCPAGMKKDYGNRECLSCQVGSHAGHVVRAGSLRLMHMESENVCICVVSTLDEQRELPAALDAIEIEF
jgi:hypothetical protein